MRQLTPSEIFKTTHARIDSWRNTPFGRLHPERDPNDMCRYCKNEDTTIVRDEAELRPFREFFKTSHFKVLHCHCCDAVFSVYWPREAEVGQ